MGRTAEMLTTIGVAIVGVATLAVLVSRGAQTPNVIKSAGQAFAGALQVAVSPVAMGGGLGGVGFQSPF